MDIFRWTVPDPATKVPLLPPRLSTKETTMSGSEWRVAQALDLAGTSNTVGAPFFAFFAKGGNHERIDNRVCAERTIRLRRQRRYPPLQKTQGLIG